MVRERSVRRAAAGDRGLSQAGGSHQLALLRPALEAAWLVARSGEGAIPPEPAPRPLRRFMQFARLPDRALDITRRVLDEDPEFRSRVLGAVGEDDVGRSGWLFLARPDGWEEELAALEHTAAEEQVQAREASGERDARHRLRGAEEARERAEAALATARAEADRLTVELAREREARAAAEAAATAADEEVRKLKAEAGSSRATAARAQERRAALEADVARLNSEVEALTVQLAAARQAAEEAPLAAPVARTDAEWTAAEPDAPQSAAPPLDAQADAVRAAVADAAAAAAHLGEALAAAAAALGGPPEPSLDDGDAAAQAVGDSLDVGRESGPSPRRRGRSPDAAGLVRIPAPLPPATFHDSPAAADHLVRLNGVVVLVDGYNVSKLRWPELSIADQRQRLLTPSAGWPPAPGPTCMRCSTGASTRSLRRRLALGAWCGSRSHRRMWKPTTW